MFERTVRFITILTILVLLGIGIFFLNTKIHFTEGSKTFVGEFLTFQYPSSWNPSKKALSTDVIFEKIDLGIPGVTREDHIGFSRGHGSHAGPPDTVRYEIVTMDTIMGYKWVRKGEGYVTYEYSAAYDDDHFHIRVTVPFENRILEDQLAELAQSINFKNK